ncbi:bacteriorhodopsin [Halorientalis pallida]|uniref:Rhodopsin n=1 Tax=Halorientalis pallida TaxID=2479928 RepID=A0A498KQD0_9EURY|nr:bacteriorhodopsin [Halorientalis pallida]RXK46387.1 rhodopsin [Halorientalis pallida]
MDPTLTTVAAGFGGGAALVGWRARGREGRARTVAVALSLLPVSIGTWYLAMATGWALYAGDRVVHWGRFADGVLAIPLLVFVLSLLADADRTTTATGMALGGYSMAATLAATLTTGAAKLAWLGVAVGAFCALLWVLFGPLSRSARDSADAAPAFGRGRNVVVALFLLYPVIWVLGAPGFALAPALPLLPARVTLDAALKLGVPLLVLAWLPAADAD